MTEERRAYQRAWYARNREKCREGRRKSAAALRPARYALIVELKSGGCIHCGETNPACLDFHHRDPKTKKFQLATGWSRAEASIRAEAAKCDILCANCHRKLEAQKRQEK